MIDFLQVIIDKQVNSDVAPSCLEMSRWYVYWWVKNSDEDDASTDTTNLFVEVSNTVMNAEAFGLENCKQKNAKWSSRKHLLLTTNNRIKKTDNIWTLRFINSHSGGLVKIKTNYFTSKGNIKTTTQHFMYQLNNRHVFNFDNNYRTTV